MPYAGLGIHIVIALICAVHVVRTGQPMYWLLILFSFPLLGSAVYFFAVYLPNSRLDRGARRAVSAAAKALDPQREVRDARLAFEDAPTAQNRMRLAAALLDVGDAEQAATEYEACLRGPFAKDRQIRLGAARALVECQRWDEALGHLESLRADSADDHAEAVTLLTARALAGLGRQDEARVEYETAVARHGTYESKAEHAIWSHLGGDSATAARLDEELAKIESRWDPMARHLNDAVRRRLAAARAQARRAG
jgi:hypothetical protein